LIEPVSRQKFLEKLKVFYYDPEENLATVKGFDRVTLAL